MLNIQILLYCLGKRVLSLKPFVEAHILRYNNFLFKCANYYDICLDNGNFVRVVR